MIGTHTVRMYGIPKSPFHPSISFFSSGSTNRHRKRERVRSPCIHEINHDGGGGGELSNYGWRGGREDVINDREIPERIRRDLYNTHRYCVCVYPLDGREEERERDGVFIDVLAVPGDGRTKRPALSACLTSLMSSTGLILVERANTQAVSRALLFLNVISGTVQ